MQERRKICATSFRSCIKFDIVSRRFANDRGNAFNAFLHFLNLSAINLLSNFTAQTELLVVAFQATDIQKRNEEGLWDH